jgi:uncharacterized protein
VLDLPVSAAWRHFDASDGFEVVFPSPEGDEPRFDGHVTAVEEGQPWALSYSIGLDSGWRSLGARIVSRSAMGTRKLELGRDAEGGWLVNGAPAPHVSGCDDIDLEASSFTNAFPVRRLGLAPGASAEAPALYVRAPDLRIERLDQRYRRLEDDGPGSRYDYASPAFGFEAVLVYDEFGFILDYPGIAARVL